MFKKEYVFYGSHANKVQALVSNFSAFSGSTLFRRNVDVLLFAPIIGFLYGNMSKIDKNRNQSTKIFVEQMINEDLRIRFNYQIITLLDKKNKIDNEKRINCTLRNIEEDTNELMRFNEYVLGGVDILHKKLIEPSKLEQDYLNNLFDFLDDINNRYYEKIPDDSFVNLYNLARE